MLDTLDNLWKEHLAAMDYLRRFICERMLKNSLEVNIRESFELFGNLLSSIRYEVIKFLSLVEFAAQDDPVVLIRSAGKKKAHLNSNIREPPIIL